MLVLSRKLHERVVFLLPDGQEIWLEALGYSRGQMSFGISGPKEIPILREELYMRMRQQETTADVK